MITELTERLVNLLRTAAKQLSGAERRKFQAQVALDFCEGSPRKAESRFGWGRNAVQTGLRELEGVPEPAPEPVSEPFRRGRPTYEQRLPQLTDEIRELADWQTQADPKFQSTFLYTRMTAKAVREALIEKYNTIERCWGVLEMHWNGTLLDAIPTALAWANSMTWKGVQPIVRLLEGIYETGARLTKSEMRPYEERLMRAPELPRWSVTIAPHGCE